MVVQCLAGATRNCFAHRHCLQAHAQISHRFHCNSLYVDVSYDGSRTHGITAKKETDSLGLKQYISSNNFLSNPTRRPTARRKDTAHRVPESRWRTAHMDAESCYKRESYVRNAPQDWHQTRGALPKRKMAKSRRPVVKSGPIFSSKV